MAEQAACKKRGTTVKRLKATIKLLSEVLGRDDNVIPTLETLAKHIASNEQAWDKFDAAHFAFLELVEEEETEAEEAEYQDLMEQVNTLIGEAEHMKSVRRGGAVQNVPAAASLEQQIDLANTELEAAFEDINGVLKSVAIHIRKTDGICQESLKVCTRQLDHAEALLEGAALKDALKELVRLNPAEAAGNTAAKALKVGEVRMILETLRGSVASTLAKVAPPVATPPRAAVTATAFKKRDPPKFDGQRRNYPSFKKEWLVSVTGKLDPTTEVREIRYSTPSSDEPDLKNLHSMDEIWEFLDEKYGKVMELSRELIMGLQKFSYSKGAKSESARFKEISREWTKVHNDLEQVEELSALDHKPTLCNIASMLPSSESKMRYAQLRDQLQDANKELRRSQAAAGQELTAEPTELHIMNTFMKAEKRLQDSYEHLCGSESEPSRASRDRSSPARCHKCGESGHQAAECEAWQFHPEEQDEGQRGARAAQAHANMKFKPRDCPVCKSQHTFCVDDGSIRYKTRLSACPNFNNLSVAERARVVEEAEGCALCLDWTGSHTRENCEEKRRPGERFGNCDADVGGAACGKKHNVLLHGSTTKFTNHVSSRINFSSRAKVVKKEHQEEKILTPSSPARSAGSRMKEGFAVRYANAVNLVKEAVIKSMPSAEFFETERRKRAMQAGLASQEKQVAEEEELASREQSLKGNPFADLFPSLREAAAHKVQAVQPKVEEKQAETMEESLRKLLEATAVQVDNTLEEMTEVESTRVKFWQVLDVLNNAEDEERASGKKQVELGQLSIRKFKQEAMLNFGNAIRRLNAKKSHEEELRRSTVVEVRSQDDAKADEEEASRRSKPAVEARKLSDLSDKEVVLLIPEETQLIMKRVMRKELNVKEKEFQELHRVIPLVMERLLAPDDDAEQ